MNDRPVQEAFSLFVELDGQTDDLTRVGLEGLHVLAVADLLLAGVLANVDCARRFVSLLFF